MGESDLPTRGSPASSFGGLCGNVCCVSAVVKDSVVLVLECRTMLYVCIRDVVFSVCTVRRGAVDAPVWEV